MNLQLALIALGILVVVAIYFYSRWQQPQNRKNDLDFDSSESLRKQPIFDRDGPSLGETPETNKNLFRDTEALTDHSGDAVQAGAEMENLSAEETSYRTPNESAADAEQQVEAEAELTAEDEALVQVEPVQEEAILEEPILQEPVLEEATQEEPTLEEPILQEPVLEEPIQDEPILEEPVLEEPTQEEVVQEEPIQEEAVQEEPVQEEIPVLDGRVDEEQFEEDIAQPEEQYGSVDDVVDEPDTEPADIQDSVDKVDEVVEDIPEEEPEHIKQAAQDSDGVKGHSVEDIVEQTEADHQVVQRRQAEPPLTLPIDAAPEPEFLNSEAQSSEQQDDHDDEASEDLDYAADAEGVVEPSWEQDAFENEAPTDADIQLDSESESEPDLTSADEAAIDDSVEARDDDLENDIDEDSELPLLELEMPDTEEGFSVLKMDDLSGKDLDEEEDLLQQRPSLAKFLSSMAPLNKIKDTIQNKLDSVKEDRKKTLVEEEMTDDEFFTMREEEAAVARKAEEERLAAIEEAELELMELEAAELEESAIILPSLNDGSTERPMDNADVEVHDSDDTESTTTTIESPQAAELNTAKQDQALSPAEGFEKLSQIDYYVKLSGERDVSRESVLAIYREAAAGLSKNHSIYGLLLPSKVWRDLENEPEESRFGDLVITVQLVDQDGPVSESEMTRFSSLVMKLSESTGRGFAFMAPIENAHEQAQAIDKFRRKFESIFVVNIRPLEDEMFEGAVIDRCAGQIGLTTDENNFYARYKPVGKQKVCLYSLANMSDTGEFDLENMRAMRTRGVTFFTRPAINRSPGAVFSEMVDAAKAFASRIKGEVIAPGYDDLSMEDVEAIRRSIEKVAREMESYGINPGSEEATRLF